MIGFCHKQLVDGDSPGCLLYYSRQKLEMSLEQIAEKLNISSGFLMALEKDDYQALPGRVYAINFFKKYADFLGLDVGRLLIKFKQDFDSKLDQDNSSRNQFGHKCLKISSGRFKLIGIGLLVLTVLGYLGSLIYQTISRPEIELTYPGLEQIVSQPQIIIAGLANGATEVKINDELVSLNNNGRFEHEVRLAQGLNKVEITAKKKYSSESSLVTQIMYLKNN